MSNSKITSLVNKKHEKDKVKISVSKSTVCRYLKKKFAKRTRKVKKVFFLIENQKKQWVEFCQMMINKRISGDMILFTD